MSEIEIESSEDLYPWAADDNEKRRAFILEFFNFNPEYHIDSQLNQLNSIERWLKGQSR